MFRSFAWFGVVFLLGACSSEPVRVTYSGPDQISICRDTTTAEFEDAETLAARFCGRKGMLPQLAGTDRCSRRAVRYDYICRPVWR